MFELLKSFYNLPYIFYTLQTMTIGNIGMKDLPTYLFFNKKNKSLFVTLHFVWKLPMRGCALQNFILQKRWLPTPFFWRPVILGQLELQSFLGFLFFNRFYTVYILSHHKPLATSRNCFFLLLSRLWPNFAFLFVLLPRVQFSKPPKHFQVRSPRPS